MPSALPRVRLIVLATLVLTLLTGCELRLATDLEIAADGSSDLSLHVGLDAETARALESVGFDPAAGLSELAEAAPGWTASVNAGEDEHRIDLQASFADTDALEAAVAELDDALAPDDGRILDGLLVTVSPDGAAEVRVQAGLVPPTVPGATGDAVAFDEDDLAALLEERGDELIRVDLRIRLPGPVVEHDADEVDGSTLVWRLPVGELREIHARSAPPADRTVPLAIAAGLLALAVGGVVTVVLRRR